MLYQETLERRFERKWKLLARHRAARRAESEREARFVEPKAAEPPEAKKRVSEMFHGTAFNLCMKASTNCGFAARLFLKSQCICRAGAPLGCARGR